MESIPQVATLNFLHMLPNWAFPQVAESVISIRCLQLTNIKWNWDVNQKGSYINFWDLINNALHLISLGQNIAHLPIVQATRAASGYSGADHLVTFEMLTGQVHCTIRKRISSGTENAIDPFVFCLLPERHFCSVEGKKAIIVAIFGSSDQHYFISVCRSICCSCNPFPPAVILSILKIIRRLFFPLQF